MIFFWKFDIDDAFVCAHEGLLETVVEGASV